MHEFFRYALNQKVLPPVVGISFMARPAVYFNTFDCLEDLYVKQNSKMTKSAFHANAYTKILKRSLIFDQTKDLVYIEKRKTLSAAFFKQKLIGMTKIIKEVTMQELKNLQQNLKEN
jgi:cytochrome P450